MLELYTQEEDTSSIKYAPDIFIDSIEYYGDTTKIYFHLSDKKNNVNQQWSSDEFFLNNVYANVSIGNQIYKKSLKNLFKEDKFKEITFSDSATFTTSNLTNIQVSAYCGNDDFRGDLVNETILSSSAIATPELENTFGYYSKIKDYTLFNNENKIFSQQSSSIKPNKVSSLYISYAPNKTANVAYVVNLENILLNNSKYFKKFYQNNKYKDIISKNTSIDLNNTKVYKRNVNNKSEEYEYVNANIKAYRLSDNDRLGDYIISWSISEDDKKSTNEYTLKLNLSINDYSLTFYDKYIDTGIKHSLQFLTAYSDSFFRYKDKNKFFETQYEKFIFDAQQVINTLASLFSFKYNKEKQEFYSFLVSCIHPLTTDVQTLNWLLGEVNKLQAYFYSLFGIDTKDLLTMQQKTTDSKLSYIKEFVGYNQNGSGLYSTVDFNYDDNYGYEVISIDSLKNRQDEIYNGLRVVSRDDISLRNRYEELKYFAGYNDSSPRVFENLSITHIDLGKNTYDLINDFRNVSYNNILLNINDYNKINYRYNEYENYYFQLLDNGVYVKTIGEKSNESYNNLEKSILFDKKEDSRQQSFKFLVDVGLIDLYLTSDNSRYDIVTSSIDQMSASIPGKITDSYFVIDDSVKNNYFQNKARLIFFYDIFYSNQVVDGYSGANYSLYGLFESKTNTVINKKLRLYNRYYILETTQNTPEQTEEMEIVDLTMDLNANIPPMYLGRNITQQEIMLNIKQI